MHIRKLSALALCLTSATAMWGQQTYMELEQLTVNEHVTTVITATEPVRFVDISTDLVAGDQPIDNTVRLKPKEGAEVHEDGEILSIVTIVTERYRVQYALVYTTRMQEAVSEKTVLHSETTPYHNPAVSLSTEDMAAFARKIWLSPAQYNVKKKANKMTVRLNNIYSVGDYFFIDFSIDNKTNIVFDIDQIRVKLEDKRKARSTNVQSLEIEPSFILEDKPSFQHGYRNIIVVRKLTFPNDKVMKIEVAEKQISGRSICLPIDYKDVLSADSFNKVLLKK